MFLLLVLDGLSLLIYTSHSMLILLQTCRFGCKLVLYILQTYRSSPDSVSQLYMCLSARHVHMSPQLQHAQPTHLDKVVTTPGTSPLTFAATTFLGNKLYFSVSFSIQTEAQPRLRPVAPAIRGALVTSSWARITSTGRRGTTASSPPVFIYFSVALLSRHSVFHALVCIFFDCNRAAVCVETSYLRVRWETGWKKVTCCFSEKM